MSFDEIVEADTVRLIAEKVHDQRIAEGRTLPQPFVVPPHMEEQVRRWFEDTEPEA